jgi:hypothetical protein
MDSKDAAQSPQEKKYATAMAGEFFALHALHRAGIKASLTLGNAKGVDIIAHLPSGRALRLEVKSIRDAGTFFLGQQAPPLDTSMFWCLISFDGQFDKPECPPRAWVVPSVCLRIKQLLTHDKGGYGTTVARLAEHVGGLVHRWDVVGDEHVSRPRSATAMLKAVTTAGAEDFYAAAYTDNWVLHGVDAGEFLDQPQIAQALLDPVAIDRLNADDLACAITHLVRAQRFAEGTLAASQASGVLAGLARRAQTLLGID